MFPGTVSAIFILTFSCFSTITSADNTNCSRSFHQLTAERGISMCKQMATLGVEFGWTINKQNERKIDIIFGANLHASIAWLAWGVNPSKKPVMVGTRAIIGVRQADYTFNVSTYNVTGDTKLGCKLQPSQIELDVQGMKTEYNATMDYLAIQATLVLPSEYNISRLNHIWQAGYVANGMEPKIHPKSIHSVESTEIINLKTGDSIRANVRWNFIVAHGILNIAGWGMFLPAGVIIARYFGYPLEKFSKWRIHIHASCQIAGYILGTTAWIIGLWLGRASKDYSFPIHGLYATFIFTFATIQMLALCLRPDRRDKYRKHWNIYHHILGYGLIVVIIMNIFKGISILKPENKQWKWFYIAVLGLFAAVVAALEIYTWTKFKMGKKPRQDDS